VGAWGVATFENDEAADWVYELEETDDLSLIAASLLEVIETAEGDYLDSREGTRALAAAEVLAALLQGRTVRLPEEVEAWIDEHPHLGGQVYREIALNAVQRIQQDSESEVKEQWEDTMYAEAWLIEIDRLIATRI
jgi:hypothetical protein